LPSIIFRERKDITAGKWKRRKLGMLHVYTGDGKGKTTAALGLGLRAAGHGFRVCMIQFMKGGMSYGEQKAVKKLPGFEIRQFGRKEFVDRDNPSKIDLRWAAKGMDFARKVLSEGKYDVVILDEINVALDWKLVTLEEVLSLVRLRRPGTELVLTGRYAHPQLMEMADYVTEMKMIAHPYDRGFLSTRGVDH
jgi:cob(I)alamin adenosyltransferase